MISVIVLLAVLALLVAMAYAGYRDGLYSATYALMRGLIGFLLAMTFCHPVAGILTSVISNTPPLPQYWVAVSFIAIFGLTLIVGKVLRVSYTDPGVGCPASVDRVAGPIVGVLNAVVFTGALLVFWSLLPFAKFVPGDQGRINAKLGGMDTGAIMLKFYAFAQSRMPGNTPFLLHDEPVELDTNGNMTAFKDMNGNGKWDHGWLWQYKHYADIEPSDLPGATSGGPAESPPSGAAP